MNVYDPLWPKRWILWWHGSGPQRGTHVMEMTGYDTTYTREIAYFPATNEGQGAQPAHEAAEKVVREHNLVVDRLRAAIKLSEMAEST